MLGCSLVMAVQESILVPWYPGASSKGSDIRHDRT
jgi:hypothetical protein